MEKLINRKDAAKLLGVSLATLDEARSSGLITYIQYVPNGCVYFTDESLQEYIGNIYLGKSHRYKEVKMFETEH